MSQLVKGFDCPVHDAQQTFRLLMDAMAKPGLVVELPSDVRFGGVSKAATQLMLTLVDNSTQVFMSSHYLNDPSFIENVRFHCAASLTQIREHADFGLLAGNEITTLNGFSKGEENYPDRSASLIIEVDSLQSGVELSLTGPGIQEKTTAYINGLSSELLVAVLNGRGVFPHGVDLFFTSGRQVMALPRTTQVRLNNKEDALCTLL
ncbi:PhnH protein [Photobacterium angustum]|uniref:phosphonate C-P lyase system protein PhnH n=1 Tax=Photobacterium angustum TaxID=661 RepID=UPI0005DB3FB6|nr:phosphonate C-P lyase system protein PhnH [Photobacterium angustum]KJF93701.1 PhnH protein [Photobacterium angustum]KJG06097.1 PhnH protein [Photobacterium angustum]PSV88526.1 phosphonate C-P lyase system protein PhnH [Photobacterium angustum]PSW81888.1 phosphonate C-P lyase system protein PhnH [Photobacterium angustum]